MADSRYIPTVGTHRQDGTFNAFPPWESIVCSVLSMRLLRSCDEKHQQTSTKRAVLTLFSRKSMLNTENNITISHHNSLIINMCDIVILFLEQKLVARQNFAIVTVGSALNDNT